MGMSLPTTTKYPHLNNLVSKGLLSHPRSNIYILGTVHIGSKSSEDVQYLIETVKPTNVIVEISPSRLDRIQRKARRAKTSQPEREIGNKDIENNQSTSSNQMDFTKAVLSLPALATEGYKNGGFSGFLFSTIIVWSSLLKRSITTNEEKEVLPRTNEFETAIFAAEAIGSNIIAADVEFEELVQSVAQSMTLLKWMGLGMNILNEYIGLQPTDPVRRKKDESIMDWENRRRDVKVARASRGHGDKFFPEISKVLVQDRDTKFAQLCLESDKRGERTVCVVGLVHVDGIVKLII